jgi:putative integral membrane protein (TIGR02587 family)
MIAFSHARTPVQSLREYGRGLAGGLMFAMPLLFTMEVWWAGFVLHPMRILLYVAATFAVLLLYNRFVGLRKDAALAEVAIDSVEEMGMGLIVAALVLWLTGRIDPEMEVSEIAGKIIMEAMTVAIGVSVGTAQLGVSGEGENGVDGEEDGCDSKSYLPQVAVALCGAVLFAANIAPTDEIRVIAMEISPLKLLLISLFSLFLCQLILHFAEFKGSGDFIANDNFIQKLRGVVTTYAVALAASWGTLFFFGKMDRQPLPMMIAQAVILAVPAVLGASAGRLLLQTSSRDD